MVCLGLLVGLGCQLVLVAVSWYWLSGLGCQLVLVEWFALGYQLVLGIG